jgi:hypothetical protein
MVQVLHLANGSTLNEKLRAPGNRVAKLVRLRKKGMSDEAMIDEIYLASLSRYPTRAEREALSEVLPDVGDPSEEEVVEDLFWGLMTSREFLFNH